MPPIPDAPAPTVSILSSIKTVLVYATMMAPAVLCMDATFLGLVGVSSAVCRKERLGTWFSVMLKMRLP